MSVWTVDTWKIKPSSEEHFLKHCGALSPDKLVLFRDLDEQSLFWSAAKWTSREELEAWRMGSTYKSALAKIEPDVSAGCR
jgi:hypothetical protein